MRENIRPAYAVEYIDHEIHGKELTVYTTSKHAAGKGDTQDVCMLTIGITSPMENVIKVSMTHFAGVLEKGPFVPVRNENPDVQITENEQSINYQSGTLRGGISKCFVNGKLAWEDGKLREDSGGKQLRRNGR